MKITNDQIVKIKEFTDLGKTAREIAEYLNITIGMVEYQRKKNRWNSKHDPNILNQFYDKIEKLINNNMSDTDIAKLFNCNSVTVYNFRKKHNIYRDNLKLCKKIELSDDVIEFILGSVMGDSYLHYAGLSTRLKCEHSIKQKEYIYHINDILKCLNPKITYTRQNTKYPAITIETKGTPSLNYIYNAFYKNKIKVIPFELFDKFTIRSLAYLFMDDGFPVGGSSEKNPTKTIGISLCNFSINELNKFISFLEKKFDLHFVIREHYNHKYDKHYHEICLKYDDFDNFKKLIEPYLCTWAKYKIYGSKSRESGNIRTDNTEDNPNPSITEM